MSNLRKVTEVSELNEAANGNTYVTLTFGAAIEGDVLKPQERRAFFCDKSMSKLIKPGMSMDVEAIAS